MGRERMLRWKQQLLWHSTRLRAPLQRLWLHCVRAGACDKYCGDSCCNGKLLVLDCCLGDRMLQSPRSAKMYLGNPTHRLDFRPFCLLPCQAQPQQGPKKLSQPLGCHCSLKHRDRKQAGLLMRHASSRLDAWLAIQMKARPNQMTEKQFIEC